jgi:hypothetical protein
VAGKPSRLGYYPDVVYSANMSIVSALIGVWEIFAPWLWGYNWYLPATLTATILGGLITITGAAAAITRFVWLSLVNVFFGLCLIIAPFALGYSSIDVSWAPVINDVVIGILTVIVGIIAAIWRRTALNR